MNALQRMEYVNVSRKPSGDTSQKISTSLKSPPGPWASLRCRLSTMPSGSLPLCTHVGMSRLIFLALGLFLHAPTEQTPSQPMKNDFWERMIFLLRVVVLIFLISGRFPDTGSLLSWVSNAWDFCSEFISLLILPNLWPHDANSRGQFELFSMIASRRTCVGFKS